MNIHIEYDGEYPNLCSGDLTVTVDGQRYMFPDYCVWFDEDWNERVETVGWSINQWPENFPEELKSPVLKAINETIPHGCCGGCI